MNETQKFPKIDAFYSHLSEQTISEDDHAHGKHVWAKFNCVNLVDYCLLYCRTDTILLAEIFQKFRKTMVEFCQLDPAYYISLPSFAWDAMLKTTDTTLECMTDIDQTLFCEQGIRGGLSFIGDRFYQAGTDKKIYYIDANVT